ncbi:MAG: hypothetical protein ACI9XO_001642 [Paraglaciecola sp.]
MKNKDFQNSSTKNPLLILYLAFWNQIFKYLLNSSIKILAKMKKIYLLLLAVFLYLPAQAWWDAGHMLTAMIAYENLNSTAKKEVDKLIKQLERDYPYANNFVSAATWADDLKAEGVRNFNSWHYTNNPYNPYGVAIQTLPQVDILWAIDQARAALKKGTVRDIDKARQLAFLIHFVGDIHQPLHSTSYYNNDLPAGNKGGNAFPIASFGRWKNLHAAWDDGCGYTSDLNDINEYGKPREMLSKVEMNRIKAFADTIQLLHPMESLPTVALLDQDFWALESHKLAVKYGYKGVLSISEEGRKKYVQPNDPLSEFYLNNGKKVVAERLALGGYRLAKILNELFPEEKK